MKHIASCSFGKDSMATIILAIEHDEPLDEVMYCKVMFDKEISGEIPEHTDFIYYVAIPWIEKHGIKVTELQSENNTFVSKFQHKITRGEKKGMLRSFPLCGRCWVNRDCKMQPINAWTKDLGNDIVQYLGIANDEQERLIRLDGVNKVSLLDKYGVCEQKAFDICRKHDLLSPMYEFTNRGGCFFCPNAKRKELRHLYDHHPDLWAKMLELQALPNKVTERFNRDMRFDEIHEKFQCEDLQQTFYDINCSA